MRSRIQRAGTNRCLPGIAPEQDHHPSKCHNATDSQVMATKATETTIRLNLRIRLLYACAQLSCWSLSNVRFAVPSNPLAFTDQNSKPDEMESQPESFPKRKTNLSPLMKTLKNSVDLSGTTKCSCLLQTRPYSRLHWLLTCVHFLRFSVCCSA
jgi:hypothetical protein